MTAYEKALSLLALREHTEKELHAKLAEKGFLEKEIREALERLKNEGSLSERRFAESFIRSRLRKSPEGKNILRMRLIEKGSPKEIADEVLNEIWENEEYKPYLEDYSQKLLRKKDQEKSSFFLQSKGFTYREVQAAFQSIAEESNE